MRLNQIKFAANQNMPHIAFGAGLAAVIGGAVLACRNTLKLEKVVDEFREDIHEVRELGEASIKMKTSYAKQEYSKDVGYVYLKAGLGIARLYGPPILLGVAGATLLTSSHIKMARQNSAMTAAFAGLDQAYSKYRETVAAKIGEKKEKELFSATNETKEELDQGARPSHKHSIYARLFDDYNPNWQKDPELNRMFLRAQETYLNQKLQADGFVLLNDVYSALGIDRSREGCLVGWLARGDGDGFVNFGMDGPGSVDFLHGPNPSVLLDFNVDGVIYDRLP